MKLKNFIDKIQPRDVMGFMLLIMLFVLKFMGRNGYVDTAIALIIGYYFSKRVYEEKTLEEVKELIK